MDLGVSEEREQIALLMEEMLEEMDWQEFFMRTMESAESMRSRYRAPTSWRSSSCLNWIWDRVEASTFRISEIVLARKSASASASADGMVPELEREFQIQQYIQTDSRSLSLSVQIWRDRIEISGIRVGLIDGSGSE